MTQICIQSNVGQNKKPTTDGESSPALPVEVGSVIEPSNNPYSILSDEDSPQVGETIEVQPEKQLEELREEPVPVEQTITHKGDEPQEGTDADDTIEDSPQVGEKIEVKLETQLEEPWPHWQQESQTECLEDVPAEQTIPITGDKPQEGPQSLIELM